MIISLAEGYLSGSLKIPLFNGTALQEYVIICCQRQQGGLLDKPDKYVCMICSIFFCKFVHYIMDFDCRPPDLYHTCYTLSGLSIAQHLVPNEAFEIIGHNDNEVQITHPVFNVPPSASYGVILYFSDATNETTIDRSSCSQSTANTEGSCADYDTLEDMDQAK